MAVIFNELLLYAKCFMDSSTVDHVKKMILHFYDDKYMSIAKKQIWSAKSGELGPHPERKSTGNRSARITNINDIIEALRKVDASEEMPPIAAMDLRKVPDRQPEVLNLLTVIDRVARVIE